MKKTDIDAMKRENEYLKGSREQLASQLHDTKAERDDLRRRLEKAETELSSSRLLMGSCYQKMEYWRGLYLGVIHSQRLAAGKEHQVDVIRTGEFDPSVASYAEARR